MSTCRSGTATRPSSPAPSTGIASPGTVVGVLALTFVLCLAALLGPNLVADELGMAMSMNMTHYMELLAVIPLTLVGITLVELGVIGSDASTALKWHATFIAVFLVVAHVAMIVGMLDPSVLGFQMAHQH